MAGFYTVIMVLKVSKPFRNVSFHSTYINEILPVYGFFSENDNFFDTLKINLSDGVSVEKLKALALEYEVNFHYFENGEIGLSIDETTDIDDVIH